MIVLKNLSFFREKIFYRLLTPFVKKKRQKYVAGGSNISLFFEGLEVLIILKIVPYREFEFFYLYNYGLS